MTISAIAILSILALAAVVALGTLGGLSIIALPISIGVSVATALGFVLTTAILIKKLKSRVVTEYRQEIIPVSQYPRPIYWGCSNFN
ncbi:putative membrane protein [Chlamydia psittaci 84-8471/1]|nr:putative membrane protein [Chlamydia psittaci 84-8471/1]